MKYYLICTLALSAAAAVCSVSAQARPNHDQAVRYQHGVPVRPFTVNNSDLQTQQGARRVYDRLRDVAGDVCGVNGNAPDWVLAQDRQCVDEAISGAVADLNSDSLRQIATADRDARGPHNGGNAPAYARADR